MTKKRKLRQIGALLDQQVHILKKQDLKPEDKVELDIIKELVNCANGVWELYDDIDQE